jgi:hypothetical protein
VRSTRADAVSGASTRGLGCRATWSPAAVRTPRVSTSTRATGVVDTMRRTPAGPRGHDDVPAVLGDEIGRGEHERRAERRRAVARLAPTRIAAVAVGGDHQPVSAARRAGALAARARRRPVARRGNGEHGARAARAAAPWASGARSSQPRQLGLGGDVAEGAHCPPARMRRKVSLRLGAAAVVQGPVGDAVRARGVR